MDTHADHQEKEWDALYAELGALLGKHGTENAFGDADFWIVDDNYGNPQHKVCMHRIAFLTRPLAIEVQRVLRKYSLAWEVLFSLDKEGMRPTETILESWSGSQTSRNIGAM